MAKKLGITVQSLSRLENSKGKIHTDRLEEICDLLDVPLMEFWSAVTGKTEPIAAFKELPLVGYVNDSSKKNKIIWSEKGLPISPAIGSVAISGKMPHSDCYALMINDSSMDPFETGWVVVVDPEGDIQNRDHVVVEYHGEVLLRRIEINDKRSFSLHVNKGFQEPLLLDKQEIKILHKAWCFISR